MSDDSKQRVATGAGVALKGAVSMGLLASVLQLVNAQHGDLATRLTNVAGTHPVLLVSLFFAGVTWYCGKPALVAYIKQAYPLKATRAPWAVFTLAFVSGGTHLWNILFGATPLRMDEETTTLTEIERPPNGTGKT